MSKQIKLTISKTHETISIAGLSQEVMIIDFETKIDYTDLVEELTKQIDSEEKVEVEMEEYDDSDEKLKLIMETTKSIFDKYNESLEITLEEDEGLPFPND